MSVMWRIFDEVILLKKHVIVGCSAKVKFRSDIKDTIVYTLKKTTCVNLLNDTALRKQNKSALSVSMFHVISPTVFKTKGLRCYYRCPVCEIYFNQADDLSCHFILVTLHNELGLSLEQPIQLTETSVDPMGETHKEMLIYHCSLEVEGELKCNVCLTYCRSLVDFVKHVASHLPWFKDVFVDYSSKSSEAAVDCLSPSTDSLCKTISNEDNSSVTKAERDTVQCCTEIKRILNEKTEKVASCDEVTQTDTKRHSKKVNLSIHHTFDKSEVCFGRNSNHNERFKTCSHILKHERRTEKSKNVCKGMLEETLASKDLNMNPQHSASVTSCINVGLTATQCPKLVPRNLIRRKKRRFTSRKRYHRCGHCNHMYSSVHSIKGHIHSHFQVQRYRSYMYECDHCNRVVSSIDSLEHHVKLHFKLIENAVGKLRCDHCNRFFSSARRLKYHIMSHFLKNICACVGCAET